MAGKLIQAAFVKPPVDATETALTTSVSLSTALGADISNDCMYSFICDQAFNINFGGATPNDPSANYMFAAGTLYSFAPGNAATHFKARATAAGTLKWWRSTYA